MFPFNYYLAALAGAFLTTWFALPPWRKWCLRVNLVDDPGRRKIHDAPVPLAGGFAVLTGSSVSLTATGAYAADGTLRAPVNGIQIVQLPTSYWDINGSTAGAGGGASPGGTWSNTTTNWSSASAGNVATARWTSGNLAVFSAGTNATGSYTVTVSGTQTASSVIIEEGSPTFTGGTITLNGTTPQINVAAGSTATVNSQISSTARVGLNPARTSRCERWFVSPIQNGWRRAVRNTTTQTRSASGTANTSNGESTASGRGFCFV